MNLENFLQHPHPFLAGMSEEQLTTLAGMASYVHYAADEVVFREGDPASRCFLIETGEVAVQTHVAGKSVTVYSVPVGEPLGWSWLFPPYRCHYDARATHATSAVFFDATILREQCERDPALGYELMKRMAGVIADRLQATRQKLVAHLKAHHELA
jgi:CRP-like cAMP-binding protein